MVHRRVVPGHVCAGPRYRGRMRTPVDIVDFEIAFACRQATDVIEVPGGVAVRHRDFPASYNNNRLLIRDAADPAALLAAADEVLADADHRLLVFLDDAPGMAFEQAALAAGYRGNPLVVMRFDGEIPPAPTIPVEELELPVMIETMRRKWRGGGAGGGGGGGGGGGP